MNVQVHSVLYAILSPRDKAVECPAQEKRQASKGKDGSMYTQTAYPVIDLAETGRSIERHRRQAGPYFGFEYPQAIYKWQHGECLPTVDNLLALARLLQVPMEDLLVYDDQGVSHFFGRFYQAVTSFFSISTANCISCTQAYSKTPW